MKILKFGLPCFALLASMQLSAAEDTDSDHKSSWWWSGSKSKTQAEDQRDTMRSGSHRGMQDSRYGSRDSGWDRDRHEDGRDARRDRWSSSRDRHDEGDFRGDRRGSSYRDHRDDDDWDDDRGDMDRRYYRDQRGYSRGYYDGGRTYRYYYPRQGGWYERRYYSDYDGWYPSYYGSYPRYYDGWYGARRGYAAPQGGYYYQREYRTRDGMRGDRYYDDRYRSDSRHMRGRDYGDDRYHSDSQHMRDQRYDDGRDRSDSRQMRDRHYDDRYRSDRQYDRDGERRDTMRGPSGYRQSPSQDGQMRRQYLSREEDIRDELDDYIGYQDDIRSDEENWDDRMDSRLITEDTSRYESSERWPMPGDQGISLDDDLNRQNTDQRSSDY